MESGRFLTVAVRGLLVSELVLLRPFTGSRVADKKCFREVVRTAGCENSCSRHARKCRPRRPPKGQTMVRRVSALAWLTILFALAAAEPSQPLPRWGRAEFDSCASPGTWEQLADRESRGERPFFGSGGLGALEDLPRFAVQSVLLARRDCSKDCQMVRSPTEACLFRCGSARTITPARRRAPTTPPSASSSTRSHAYPNICCAADR